MRQGYKVYPFWEADILGNKSAVKEKVKEILNEYK
jgi:very-short-patch-repair endonuclease